MCRLFCLILILLSSNALKSQNLVPNAGFESFTNCPDGSCQWNYLDSWDNVNGSLACNQSAGSPDFFHTCGDGFFELPLTLNGNVNALGGDGIVGLSTYVSFAGNFREYLSVELTQALTIGKTYNVRVPFTNGTSDPGASYGGFGTEFGVHFSTGALTQTGSDPILITPTFETTGAVFNTAWQTLLFSFEATTAATHLTIGNFRNDANSTYQQFATPSSAMFSYAYYFFDDIEVEEATILSANFSSFEARSTEGKIAISWNVEQIQEGTFLIEKSVGSTTFNSIAKIDVNQSRESYHYHDLEPRQGINYYRIKYLDIDGESTYSPIISATYASEKYWDIVQNPSTLSVSILSEETVPWEVNLFNSSGQAVWHASLRNKKELQLPTTPFPKGIYVLKIRSNQQMTYKKILIQ